MRGQFFCGENAKIRFRKQLKIPERDNQNLKMSIVAHSPTPPWALPSWSPSWGSCSLSQRQDVAARRVRRDLAD
jgi:hypothetical protein